MTERVIKTDEDRRLLLAFIKTHQLPFTVKVTEGAMRSTEQNRLQRQWINEIASQSGHTQEEVRGYCKLKFGVPLVRESNDKFRAEYDRLIAPMSVNDRLGIMQLPIDLPVTRLMTSKVKAQYLDEMFKHFTEMGMSLTRPEG